MPTQRATGPCQQHRMLRKRQRVWQPELHDLTFGGADPETEIDSILHAHESLIENYVQQFLGVGEALVSGR